MKESITDPTRSGCVECLFKLRCLFTCCFLRDDVTLVLTQLIFTVAKHHFLCIGLFMLGSLPFFWSLKNSFQFFFKISSSLQTKKSTLLVSVWKKKI